MQVLVAAQIVLQLQVGQNLLAFEFVKGDKQVPHPQDRAKQRDELPLILLPGNARFAQRETLGQLRDHTGISGVEPTACIGIAFVIIAEFAQHDDAAGVGVAKQADGRIHPILQVAEADDVAEGLDRIEDAVGAAERLDQAMHFQIFVHPKGVEGGGIEAGQEHIDHDQQVKLLVFHPQ